MRTWFILLISMILSYSASTHVCLANSSNPSSLATSFTLSKNIKPLRIAVSSNFAPVLSILLPEFIDKTGIKAEIISGASGALYQQIHFGAPFDLFLSADDVHPKRLQAASLVFPKSLTTYAIGQLAFWSSDKTFNAQHSLLSVLTTYRNNSSKIAIANPKSAPYGQRAVEVLQHLGFWQTFNKKIITGVNVNQTFQQIRSQSVNGGFVALSQLRLNKLKGIRVEQIYYQPIEQQLVILKNSKKIAQAKQFLNFLFDKNTQQRIEGFGYSPLNANPISTTTSPKTLSLYGFIPYKGKP